MICISILLFKTKWKCVDFIEWNVVNFFVKIHSRLFNSFFPFSGWNDDTRWCKVWSIYNSVLNQSSYWQDSSVIYILFYFFILSWHLSFLDGKSRVSVLGSWIQDLKSSVLCLDLEARVLGLWLQGPACSVLDVGSWLWVFCSHRGSRVFGLGFGGYDLISRSWVLGIEYAILGRVVSPGVLGIEYSVLH